MTREVFEIGQVVRINKRDKTRGPSFDNHGKTGEISWRCGEGYHVSLGEGESARHYASKTLRRLFKVGDIAVITNALSLSDSWVGLKVRIDEDEKPTSSFDHGYLKVTPLSKRPDGNELNWFNWDLKALEHSEPEQFKPGDIVEIIGTSKGNEHWLGFKAEVNGSPGISGGVWLYPLSERPDGGTGRFRWSLANLRKVGVKETEPAKPALPNTVAEVDALLKEAHTATQRLTDHIAELEAHKLTLTPEAPGSYKLLIVANDDTGFPLVLTTDYDGDVWHAQRDALWPKSDGENQAWRKWESACKTYPALREGRYKVLDRFDDLDDDKIVSSW